MSENVVEFSTFKKTPEAANFNGDKLETNPLMGHEKEFSSAMVMDLVEVLRSIGYNIEDTPEVIKDIVILTENVESLVMRMHGKQHPMQEVTDAILKNMTNTKEIMATFLGLTS